MNQKLILGIMILAVGAVALSGCLSAEKQPSVPQISPPSTTPVTRGYIQSFNHTLNYGFEYPEDWEMQSLELSEYSLSQGIKNAEMFIKTGEGTSITIIAKTTNWENLDEVKNLYNEGFADTIVKERIIEVNGIKGYEMTRLDPPMKFKVVVFLVNGMAYEFDYGTTEELYDASEEIFDHVVNSFNVQ